MPPAVVASRVGKTFRQHRRFSGLRGALRTLTTREFTEVRAVEDVSVVIEPGEAVGYLGPNGAGKSTMIKMLTGILVPSSGTVSVLGRDPHRSRMANAREIGVVFGQRSQLWWDLPVIDSFRLHQAIYRIEPGRFRQNLDAFADLLDLGQLLDRPVRQLSLGQRMRCEVVMALLHDPRILFLDEPTIGLDVMAKDAVRSFLTQVNRERGVTVILTTHDMADIETICPRLIMVDQGRLLFDGPLPEVRAALGARRLLRLDFAEDPGPIALSGAELVSDEVTRKTYRLSGDATLIDLIAQVPRNAALRDAAILEPGIEDAIRAHYQGRG